MIPIKDLTHHGVRTTAINRNAKICDLGGYPKHIEGVPYSLWNPRGDLDFHVDYVADPLYAGGALKIKNALKWKRNKK